MRILVTAPYHSEGIQELEQVFGKVVYKPWKTHGRAFHEHELIELLLESRADALVTEHDEVSARVIKQHSGLNFIGVCRSTPSNVDVVAASRCGIPVFNAPARNAQAVAELFIANLITFMRKTLPAVEWLRAGQWGEGAHTSYLQFKGEELAGKRVGMVGFGAVAQTIAQILKGFPCEISYYDPFYIPDNRDYKQQTIDELFHTADVVSVHLPVTESTRGMIDRKLLNLMQPEAIFVNTARAVVVDREALLEVIENGRIKGAILDVFDHEPPDEMDYRLIHHERVLATPHIAGATHDVEDHHVRIMNDALVNYFINDDKNIKEWVNRPQAEADL